MTASEIIEALGLRRHPEGGYFKETWRDVPEGGVATEGMLGSDLARGERPQLVVPAGAWQSARSRAGPPEGYTLVGCTVSPAFRFEGFELAPESFEEGG